MPPLPRSPPSLDRSRAMPSTPPLRSESTTDSEFSLDRRVPTPHFNRLAQASLLRIHARGHHITAIDNPFPTQDRPAQSGPYAVLHIRGAATTSDPSWIRQVVRGSPAHSDARRAERDHLRAPCHGQSQKSMTVLLVGAVRSSVHHRGSSNPASRSWLAKLRVMSRSRRRASASSMVSGQPIRSALAAVTASHA